MSNGLIDFWSSETSQEISRAEGSWALVTDTAIANAASGHKAT